MNLTQHLHVATIVAFAVVATLSFGAGDLFSAVMFGLAGVFMWMALHWRVATELIRERSWAQLEQLLGWRRP